MKKLVLSIALLAAIPTFSSQDSTQKESSEVVGQNVIVQANYYAVGDNGLIGYFYTKACARAFKEINGGTIYPGPFYVDEGFVYVCEWES